MVSRAAGAFIPKAAAQKARRAVAAVLNCSAFHKSTPPMSEDLSLSCRPESRPSAGLPCGDTAEGAKTPCGGRRHQLLAVKMRPEHMADVPAWGSPAAVCSFTGSHYTCNPAVHGACGSNRGAGHVEGDRGDFFFSTLASDDAECSCAVEEEFAQRRKEVLGSRNGTAGELLVFSRGDNEGAAAVGDPDFADQQGCCGSEGLFCRLDDMDGWRCEDIGDTCNFRRRRQTDVTSRVFAPLAFESDDEDDRPCGYIAMSDPGRTRQNPAWHLERDVRVLGFDGHYCSSVRSIGTPQLSTKGDRRQDSSSVPCSKAPDVVDLNSESLHDTDGQPEEVLQLREAVLGTRNGTAGNLQTFFNS